jgi:hypothetical protein
MNAAKPTSSATAEKVTIHHTRPGRGSVRVTMSGAATAETPITRATRIVHNAPSSVPAFELPTSPTPKLHAAAIA